MIKRGRIFLKATSTILKDSLIAFINDRVFKLSAALAYYTVFSLPSMLIVIIGISSIFFGKKAVQGQVFFEIERFIGPEAAEEIEIILQKTTLHHDNALATGIGIVTLLLGATGMFGEMQDSINYIWRLKAKPDKGIMRILLARLTSFSMVLVLGFLLCVSLLVNALLSSFFERLKAHLSPVLVDNLFIVNNLVLFGVTCLLFAFIFKALPDARLKWRDVWISSVVTTALFAFGEFVISYILMHSTRISAYGAAGSIVILLLWVYYSSIILYFGAEFTQAYARYRGRSIRPNKYAVWVESSTVERHSSRLVDKTKET